MRGKKIDNEFVSSFIEDCVKKGFSSKEDFVRIANDLIGEIDKQIKEVEVKKIQRSKLLDVVNTFAIKESNEELKLYAISNLDLARAICNTIKHNQKIKWTPDAKLCIKELTSKEILSNNKPGRFFDDFMKKVLKEC